MGIFNFGSNKKTPSQYYLGKSGNIIGSAFGLGFEIDEFNLYSQVKDYRTDLLNGTNWTSVNYNNFATLQFIRMLWKYSTSIFNDYCSLGYSVFAKIDDKIFYVSAKNYTKSDQRISIHGYPNVEVFCFEEPNAFCGEKTIYQKCEPYQRLYNIALSCQKNGMSKSGYVNVISPKTPSAMPAMLQLTDEDIRAIEKDLSENHGVNGGQNNMLILRREVDIKTMMFDSTKMGILDAKKICEEFVCSKLGVPRMLVSGTELTYANYEEANKILYENHSKYLEYFCNFVKNEIGLDITYKTIAEQGKGII